MLVSSHIDSWARTAARSRYALLLCLSFALSACKLDAKPPSGGGLVVALDTDMSMPKDIDEVRLEVTQGATMLFQHSQQLDENAAALPLEIQVPDANDSAPVLVRALGVKDGEVRVERSAITTVPTAYLGYLRLILNYLCDGMVTPNGDSSCGATMTCIQGTCEPAAIATTLPDFYQREGSVTNASTTCFDVAKCFSMATEMTPELADGCTFQSNKLFPTDINVALRLEPGSGGICTQTACWIVLDSDGDGFRVGDDERVVLPESICAQRALGANLRVAMSMQCPSKKQSIPLCRDGSSASVGDPDNPVDLGMSLSPVSDACAGGGQRACEMCGTTMRMCRSGLWSDFGMCVDQGVCIPETVESCGVNGIRTCGGDCTWGDCENQTCEGPATRSCGNCGTQHRSCNNGAWSEWSACGEEGVCMPGASQACGSGGSQACMGNCDWADCTMQVCAGPASEPCGNCGTRSRTCDANTAVWSDWGECEGEGECRPDSTQPCGRDGEQTCGGNCRWDVACAGQTCEGPARRACGLCGTQTRTCDMMTGEYSDWSACFGEGECMPDSISACGNGGERVCGGMCRWGATCTGQTCTGPSTEACGNCGTRTRTCDTNTGAWSDWSQCRNQGDCAPGAMQACGSGGMQTCTSACRWDDACPGQNCGGGRTTRVCPSNECVSQTRTCDANTGNWSDWNPTCMPGCEPGTVDTSGCSGNAQRGCTPECGWGACACIDGFTSCPGVGCVNFSNDEAHCGDCNRPCAAGQTCEGGMCQCPMGTVPCGTAPNITCVNVMGSDGANCGACGRACGGNAACMGGTCTCQNTGGMSQLYCDMRCVDSLTDESNCGECGNRCTGGQDCVRNTGTSGPPAICQCPEDRPSCGGPTCLDLTTDEDHCGDCNRPCAAGEVCEAGRCQVTCTPPSVRCGSRCVDLQTDGTHCGDCDMPCMNNMICQGGSCGCAPGYGPCGPNNACVPLNTITNCRACGVACTGGAMCEEDGCGCPTGEDRCGGPGTACVRLDTAENCGGCNSPCAAGTMCMGGMCRPQCMAPTDDMCGRSCVDTQTDEQHCGGCNSPCAAGTMCMGGSCQPQCTAPNDDMCGGSCVDTQTDERHCGGCNSPCGTMCMGGMCQPQCTAPNDDMCGGSCVDTQTDERHCGGCNSPCAAGSMCMGGTCRPQCTAPTDDMCGGSCVDTQTDERHCGGCNSPCAAGSMCMGGMCQPQCTAPNDDMCNGTCVNTQNDEQHCGGCNSPCASGTMCMGGMCRPQCNGPNNELCDGMCVNTRNNDQHCGGCNRTCTGGATCNMGECEAPPDPGPAPTPQPPQGGGGAPQDR